MSKHVAKRTDDGYVYRGQHINRADGLQAMLGHKWVYYCGRATGYTRTLAGAKKGIDRHLDMSGGKAHG